MFDGDADISYMMKIFQNDGLNVLIHMRTYVNQVIFLHLADLPDTIVCSEHIIYITHIVVYV
jgi:hypothetical protein